MTASARGFGWGKKGSFSRARAPADVTRPPQPPPPPLAPRDVYEKNEKNNETMSVYRQVRL